MLRIRSFVAAGAVAALAASGANAAMMISGVVGGSTEGTGANFSGMLDYVHNGGSSGTLTVALTNTTPPSVGGFLTAFLFNFGTMDPTASAALTSSAYAALTDAAGAGGQPFGKAFLGGAGTGGQFEGGGPPSGGIAIGDTGMFVFAITATDAGGLTDASFLEGPYAYNFVVRFRGLANGGSDKVPAPTPGVAATLLFAGLGATARRRR